MLRLLDTDVMVDLFRRYPPAIRWMESQVSMKDFALPGLVYLELIAGCRNKAETMDLHRWLRGYAIYWPSDDDMERSLLDFSEVHLTHRLDIVDTLIAECAVGRGAILCTFNQKHFKAIPDLKTEQPYERK
jgi:predicted nucleic acid-binding protein